MLFFLFYQIRTRNRDDALTERTLSYAMKLDVFRANSQNTRLLLVNVLVESHLHINALIFTFLKQLKKKK
jgi:hypothetical protein